MPEVPKSKGGRSLEFFHRSLEGAHQLPPCPPLPCPAGLWAAPPPVQGTLQGSLQTLEQLGLHFVWVGPWGTTDRREVCNGPAPVGAHLKPTRAQHRAAGCGGSLGVSPRLRAHPTPVCVCVCVFVCAERTQSRAGPLIPKLGACSRWAPASLPGDHPPLWGCPWVLIYLPSFWGGRGGKLESAQAHTELRCSIFWPLYFEPGRRRGAGAVVRSAQEPFLTESSSSLK